MEEATGEEAQAVLGGRDIEEVLEAVRKRGGLTLDPRTGKEPSKGYVVNEPGECPSLPLEALYNSSAREMVIQLLGENREWYTGKHLGIWKDDEKEKVTFDRVDVLENREDAIRVGEERRERSIWDVERGEEVELSAGRKS